MSLNVVLAIVLAVLLGACTGSPGADGDEPGPSVADGAAGDGGDGEGSTTVEVNVESGELAGTYTAEGPKLDCNVSDTGSGATFLDMDVTNGVYSVTFVSVEGGTDPDNFSFGATFAGEESFTEDPMQDSGEVYIADLGFEGQEPEGEGTAHMTESGDMITWDVEGTTADGVAFTATITCGPVDRR